jgi:DNA polymerase-3 subunit epsilon
MRQVFLDTETTGLSPESGDRIVEIGCVEFVNRRPTGRTFHVYLNPERPNSPGAFDVHKLSDQFLADKPLFGSVVDELIDFVRDAEVVIHNAAFDVGFLDQELVRAGRRGFSTHGVRVVDSLALARDAYPGQRLSLDALCKRLEVDNSARTAHGALLDAGLLAEVYIRMTRGQGSFVIDVGASMGERLAVDAIDLSTIHIVVLQADPGERAAHDALLAGIDKASGGCTVWRRFEPMPVPQFASSAGG